MFQVQVQEQLRLIDVRLVVKAVAPRIPLQRIPAVEQRHAERVNSRRELICDVQDPVLRALVVGREPRRHQDLVHAPPVDGQFRPAQSAEKRGGSLHGLGDGHSLLQIDCSVWILASDDGRRVGGRRCGSQRLAIGELGLAPAVALDTRIGGNRRAERHVLAAAECFQLAQRMDKRQLRPALPVLRDGQPHVTSGLPCGVKRDRCPAGIGEVGRRVIGQDRHGLWEVGTGRQLQPKPQRKAITLDPAARGLIFVVHGVQDDAFDRPGFAQIHLHPFGSGRCGAFDGKAEHAAWRPRDAGADPLPSPVFRRNLPVTNVAGSLQGVDWPSLSHSMTFQAYGRPASNARPA